MTADGAGSFEPVVQKRFAQHVNSVASNGVLVFHENNPETGIDLWTLAEGTEPEPFATTRFRTPP